MTKGSPARANKCLRGIFCVVCRIFCACFIKRKCCFLMNVGQALENKENVLTTFGQYGIIWLIISFLKKGMAFYERKSKCQKAA